MPNGRWVDYAAQSLLHAFVAALALEALLRVWRARSPDDRLAIRALGLCQPLAVTPALFLLAPRRAGEDFHESWALFASRRWDEFRVGGLGLLEWGVLAAGALGLALFLMDLAPLLSGRRRRLSPAAAAPATLASALADVSARRRAPALHFLEEPRCALYCAGVLHPVLVVSRGALELLDAEELRAALAHELAHLERRDPALSWGLMACRAALFFNPVAQVVARALARDAEWSADERAGPDRLALASALVKLHRAGHGRGAQPRRRLPLAAALAEPLRRARSHDVEARCRRLMEPAPPQRLPFPALRAGLASVSLAAIAFFVT